MAETKTTDFWDTYVAEIPFPGTNSAEAVADAAAGTSTAKGGEDASSPLPRFRMSNPDEIDLLLQIDHLRRQGQMADMRVKNARERVSELNRELDDLHPRTVRAILGSVSRWLYDAEMCLTAFVEAK